MLKQSRKSQRIDERGGTIEEYVARLEQWVKELKLRNEYLEQQLATATAGGSVCSPPEIIARAVASRALCDRIHTGCFSGKRRRQCNYDATIVVPYDSLSTQKRSRGLRKNKARNTAYNAKIEQFHLLIE